MLARGKTMPINHQGGTALYHQKISSGTVPDRAHKEIFRDKSFINIVRENTKLKERIAYLENEVRILVHKNFKAEFKKLTQTKSNRGCKNGISTARAEHLAIRKRRR